jgi:hypothetical protein
LRRGTRVYLSKSTQCVACPADFFARTTTIIQDSSHRPCVASRCRRHCVHCLAAPTAWTCEAHCGCDAAACAQTLQRAPFIHGIERHGAAEHVTSCNIHQGSGNIARHDDHATQRPGLRNSPAPAACWLNIEAAFQRASS